MVAALGALALFGLIALAVISAEVGNLAGMSAFRERVRLEGAADAGLALAVQGLALRDAGARWRIDGRPRTLGFEGVRLTIRVEDERGKLRLNALTGDQVRDMFVAAGATGARRDGLADAFLDWRDEDDERRPFGAETGDYAPLGVHPRNGALQSVAELRAIRGMDDALYARLAPAVTVFSGERGAFDETTAQPLALAVMTSGGQDSPAVIARARELAGQTPALAIGDPPDLAARPLTVRIAADDGVVGHLDRATIIEFPRGLGTDWVVRARE